MIGFAGATPGRNMELDPTAYSVVTQERDGFPAGSFRTREKDLEAGITARWGFRPSVTLNATVNPDFSNVEADVAQLDINTQFALYYPEGRPFFLEGASFFATPLRAVYTRTLADPIWGMKLTGKEGGNTVGFFTVHDDLTNLLFPGSQGSDMTSLGQRTLGTVLRYRRDLGRSSNIGALVTDREGTDYYNRVGGLDGLWRVTSTDQIGFQVLGSHTRYPESVHQDFNQPAGSFTGGAYDLSYFHRTRSHDWQLRYRQVDRGFRSDLGFMPKAGYRFGEVGGGHTWNGDPDSWWNTLRFSAGYGHEWDLDGTTLDQGASIWFNYAGLAQTFFNVMGHYGQLYYNGTEFDDAWMAFDMGIRPSGLLFLVVRGTYGQRVDYANSRPGTRIQLDPYAELNLGRHLTLGLYHTYERLDVDEGRLYSANISQTRVVYSFTRRVFLRAILQYVHYNRNTDVYTFDIDPISKSLFSQLLLSCKINPQTVFYLGYSDNYAGDHEIGLTQSDRTLFVKIGYAWVM